MQRITKLERELKEEKTRGETIKEACQKYLDEEVMIKADLKHTKELLEDEKEGRARDVELLLRKI